MAHKLLYGSICTSLGATWQSGIPKDGRILSTAWISAKAQQGRGGAKIFLIQFQSYSVKLMHEKIVGGSVFTHTSVPWAMKVISLEWLFPFHYTEKMTITLTRQDQELSSIQPFCTRRAMKSPWGSSGSASLACSLASSLLADWSQSCTKQRVKKNTA